MKIAVLGAGAWGTALALSAVRAGHAVRLWARDAAQAGALQAQHENRRYLAGVALPAALQVGADLGAAQAHGAQGLIVIATPMSALRERLAALPPAAPALWLCKGFEAGSGRLGHEIARETGHAGPCGVLSGPSFAIEVARGQPTALVAASLDPGLRQLAQHALHHDSLRVYTADDVVGVEVGGAVKNVVAIATGILDGLADATGTPALNARAALVTRALAEITRFGIALGARADTFMGLSGLGDLVLTSTGALSRNRQVGLRLAQGATLADVLAAIGHVAEGVYSAATVLERARSLGVEMPITVAVAEVLAGRLAPAAAVARLMAREARAEGLPAGEP